MFNLANNNVKDQKILNNTSLCKQAVGHVRLF